MTRQQEWQRRKVASGRCRRCGKIRDGKSRIYCARCRAKETARMRLTVKNQGA